MKLLKNKVSNLLKRILYVLPISFRKTVVLVREWYWRVRITSWEKQQYPNLPEITSHKRKVKNVLIYHISGLTHAGTEKNLQLIANSLVDEYEVYFMYGEKGSESERKETLDSRIKLIPFSYELNEVNLPHRLHGMKPHLKEVLVAKDIDLIITASPGYAHYPWNIISKIPIVLSNVFGAPTLQKNIAATIFMSETVQNHAEGWVGRSKNSYTRFLPIGKLPPKNCRELGGLLRKRLGILDTDFVFGRIGRDDNNIFDPIGIRAWQKIAPEYPHAHLLVMSPPPILVKIVKEEKISRVHFLPPSGKEDDVWAFHGAIDAMSHFRRDGETSGVAIAESLTIGNPIITHKSHIWNAHLEYLTADCSRVAEIDDFNGYADYMEEFIDLKINHSEKWQQYIEASKQCGEKNFSPVSYIESIQSIVSKLHYKNDSI